MQRPIHCNIQLIHYSTSAHHHLRSQTQSSARERNVMPAGKRLWRSMSFKLYFDFYVTQQSLHFLSLPFCPFSPPGTAGKSSPVRRTSPDTCGHTQGNNPTGILFFLRSFHSLIFVRGSLLLQMLSLMHFYLSACLTGII